MWLEEPDLAKPKWLGVRPQPIKNADGEIVDWPTDDTYAKWSLSCTSD